MAVGSCHWICQVAAPCNGHGLTVPGTTYFNTVGAGIFVAISACEFEFKILHQKSLHF